MHKQILTELQANLERFAKATDPRNISASKTEILQIFKSCHEKDKELLTEMSTIFFETKSKHPSVNWKKIEFALFGKIIDCVNCYIDTREEALDYLSEEEEILRPVLTHLMKKYKISADELRHVREQIFVG